MKVVEQCCNRAVGRLRSLEATVIQDMVVQVWGIVTREECGILRRRGYLRSEWKDKEVKERVIKRS